MFLTLRNVAVCWIILHVMVISSHQQQLDRSDSPYDAIVIGAGASGIAALTRLHQAGLRVLGLEAGDRIGGRVRTRKYGTGVVEFGAEWMHGYNTVYEIAEQAQVPIIEKDITDFLYLSPNGSEMSCNDECVGMLFNISTVVNSITRNSTDTIEEYVDKAFEAHISSSPELIARRPQLEALLTSFKHLAMTAYGLNDWSEISPKAWTEYHEVQGPHNLYWATETGYQGLFHELMKKTTCHRDSLTIDIKFNKEAVYINWLPEVTTGPVSVKCADGTEYRASKVLITVSLGVLKASHRTMFRPSLPASKIKSINIMEMGSVVKMFLRYETSWWGDETNFGFVWLERERTMLSEEDRWLEKIGWVSVPAGSDNILTLWTSGPDRKFIEKIPLEILKLKLDGLMRMFCGSRFPEFQDSVELKRTAWISHPYFLGTYSYHGLDSHGTEDPTEGLREPITHSGKTRLLFAGEATSTHHFSTVHGAVESGWREADRILAERFH